MVVPLLFALSLFMVTLTSHGITDQSATGSEDLAMVLIGTKVMREDSELASHLETSQGKLTDPGCLPGL